MDITLSCSEPAFEQELRLEHEPQIGRQVKLLHNAFEQALNQSLLDFGLTGVQSFFLHFLYCSRRRGQPVYSKELSAKFQLKHSTVSGILQRLEANGFIRFVADPQDHRLKQIVLTEQAYQCHEQMTAAFVRMEEKVLQGFTAEETELFCRFLARAIDNIGAEPRPQCKRGNL